jgi:hypothetical protein
MRNTLEEEYIKEEYGRYFNSKSYYLGHDA